MGVSALEEPVESECIYDEDRLKTPLIRVKNAAGRYFGKHHGMRHLIM